MIDSLPEDDRLAALRSALRAQGLDLELHGDVAVLRIDEMRLERPWRWVDPHRFPREPDAEGPEGGWLLLADRMSPDRARAARERGDWYADASGRVHVRAHGVLIDVRDRPVSVKRSAHTGTVRRAQNPMSPRRAQVVCALLEEPVLVPAGLRTIAERSGVSVGTVQQVLSDLGDRRFLTHDRSGLNRVDELLDQWTAAFASGLGARLELGRFTGDAVQLGAWIRAGHVVYLSGEAASDELNGTDATIYVARLDLKAVIASRWSPKGERPNVVVRRQFWSDPGRAPGVHDAPLTLQLADLLVTDDPRHRLAARPLRERILDRHVR